MLAEILKDVESQCHERSLENIQKLIADLTFVLCSYQSKEVVSVALRKLAVMITYQPLSSEQLASITEKCFQEMRNVTSDITNLFYNLICACPDETQIQCMKPIFWSVFTHLSGNELKTDQINALMKILDSLKISKLRDSDIRRCVMVFSSLLRIHSVKDIPLLVSIVTKMCNKRAEAFIDSLNNAPNFLSFFLRNFDTSLTKEVKLDMIIILLKLMEYDRLKFVIGNNNSLLDALENDMNPEVNPGRTNVVLRTKAKLLFDAIMDYKRMLIETSSANVPSKNSANLEVKELSDINIDLSSFEPLTPKIVWWQSETKLFLEVQIFGTVAKRIWNTQ